MQPCPLVASAAVAALVTGPRRPVEVVAATPRAIYLATGDPELPALCLATPDAVRVPCALVARKVPFLARSRQEGAVPGGTVGAGTLTVGPFTGRVARWWRPPRPRGLTAARLRAVAVQLASRVRVKLDPEAEAALDDLTRGLATGGPVAGPVRRLLGRGPGLTPLGDDVLAGALVTLGALGDPGFARLGAEVDALAPTRTTFVSAALLRHAARGECVPELAALLDGGSPDALLRVGHTSGAGLALGVLTTQDRHNFGGSRRGRNGAAQRGTSGAVPCRPPQGREARGSGASANISEVVPSDRSRGHYFREVVPILGAGTQPILGMRG